MDTTYKVYKKLWTIINLFNFVYESMEKNKNVTALVLDLSKAFDTIYQFILLT